MGNASNYYVRKCIKKLVEMKTIENLHTIKRFTI